MVVVPKYPGSPGGLSYGEQVNAAKAAALDSALEQLRVPLAGLTHIATTAIPGSVKTFEGRVISNNDVAGRSEAMMALLQAGQPYSAAPGVLDQLKQQKVDARNNLAELFWLAVTALTKEADKLRKQHRRQPQQQQQQQ
ncbi:hypothetical protein OEZ86_012313 [Tetradesmus obliquus]|nr:hypothetical protein OEZ86_012313 [Tetradesmus obliquus]